MTRATPLRFVAGLIGLWTAGRVMVLAPDMLTAPAEADPPSVAMENLRPATTRQAFTAGRPPVEVDPPVPRAGGRSLPAERGGRLVLAGVPSASPRAAASPAPRLSPTGLVIPLDVPGGDTRGPSVAVGGSAIAHAEGAAGDPPTMATARSRLSGGVYLYRRGESGAPPLATGGQLGGSQAGARVAWALGPAGTSRVALAARLSTPLDDARGAEAAAGIDFHPLPGRPLRISIERRVDLGGAGRDAWSGYAAGGFWRPLGGGLVADGYAQAGIVGARRRDLFADGALRLGHRRELGGGRALTLGAGAWGAAQPRVSRFDIGPRAALSFPLGGTAVTAAAEWRIRVGGDARPGSGLALTLASDF